MRKVKNNEIYLLKQIANLSAFRDIEQFELTLLETLASILDVSHVHMFKIYEIHKGYQCLSYQANDSIEDILIHRCSPEKLQQISDLPEQVQSARKILTDENILFQQKESAGFHYIVLSEHNIEATAYISFESKNKLRKKEKKYLKHILTITKNFCDILEDSQFDNLTGLLNRKTFDKNIYKIQQLYANTTNDFDYKGKELRSNPQDSDYCLAIMDIDLFKKINDMFGHVYGDEVLLLLAQIMKNTFRAYDLLFRFGGEEFVVIIKVDDLEMAQHVLERFRKTIENYQFPQLKQVTISIGATHLEKSYLLPEDIVDRADKALYYAKEHGRNQLHFYETLIATGELVEKDRSDSLDFF